MKAIDARQRGHRSTGRIHRTRKRVHLLLDGQVHRLVLVGLTRRDTEAIHAHGDQSSTRLRLRGKARGPGGWRVDARIGFEFQSNPPNRVDDTRGAAALPSLRKARVRFQHRTWESVAIGRGSTATSGITSIDLSGCRLAMYSNIDTAGGGQRHTDSARDPPAGGTTVGAVRDTYDGASRDGLLGYDSPKWYGFWASFSWAQGDIVHASVRLVGHSFGLKRVRVAAGVGWVHTPREGAAAPGNPPAASATNMPGRRPCCMCRAASASPGQWARRCWQHPGRPATSRIPGRFI